jgi:hypothetical protein
MSPHPLPGWEIPTLDIATQATDVPNPAMTWGSIGREKHMPGTYMFYADDRVFNGLWKQPDKIFKSECKVVGEVNYSTFDTSTEDEVLMGIYRKRVLSKYWGSQGLKILVDLDIAPNYLDDYALLGVPKGWRAYSTRSHRLSGMEAIEREHALAVEHAGTDKLLFVVYGGSKKIAAACEERGFMRIPEHIEVVRGRADAYMGGFHMPEI